MNRQQKLLCTMLDEIIDICNRNDITYFIVMGTLIGAVRNRGLLPWDDDIDVMMTYDNWLKFKEACKTQLPPNRYLGSADEDVEYGHLLPRYISTETTAIHTAQSLNDTVAGELIDIFLIDPIPDDERVYDEYRRDLYLYTTVINYANVAAYRYNLDPELYRSCLDRIQSEGALTVRRELEARIVSHHAEEGQYYAFRWQGAPVRFKRWWFEDTITLEFEGRTVNAPKGIDEFLTCYYGEEWPEVPGDIAPAKHNTAASLDFSYRDALTYFRPTFDRAELIRQTEKRRYMVLQHAPEANHQHDQIVKARAKAVELETLRTVEENRPAFERAVKDKDGVRLAGLLRDYLKAQSTEEMIGRNSDKGYYRFINPIIIAVPDEIRDAGLLGLMATNHIRHAHLVIKQLHLLKHPLSDECAQLERLISAFNDARTDYQFGRIDQALEKAQHLFAKLPCVGEFLKLVVVCHERLCKIDPTPEQLAAFKAAIDTGIAAYPADGFFVKKLGDWHYAKGEDELGRMRYLDAAESTRNGLTLLAIADKTGYHPTWMREPQWAREAGVPQWDGPVPQPLKAPKSTEDSIPADRRQRFLLGLLQEVTDTCDAEGLPYVLGPTTAQALSVQRRYPSDLEGYQIVLKGPDALKLTEALEARTVANRSLEYMGTSRAMNSREIRYHADDTTVIDLSKASPNQFNSLCVRILPLEVPELSGSLTRSLADWDNASQPAGTGRRAQIHNKIKRLKTIHLNGKQLFTAALEAPIEATGLLSCEAGTHKPDAAYLEQRTMLSFDGRTFWIPEQITAYLADTKPKAALPRLDMKKSVVCTCCCSERELLKSCGIDASFFRKRDELRRQQKVERDILKDFRFNFQQIKLAVETKKLALELLPCKDELLALGKSKDYDALAQRLAAYIAVADTYEKYGECNFDDELFALMKETRLHANA